MGPILIDEDAGIMYRKWTAPSAKAVFLLVHGFGAHSERWEFLADFFLRRGFSSYAIELKGFGETKGLRGHVDSFDTYLEDVRGLRRITAAENPGKKIIITGESLGGLIAFLAASRGSCLRLFDALICISPAFKDRLKRSFPAVIGMLIPLIYNPKEEFQFPFASAACTRDTDYAKKMDTDPREHRFATSKFIFEVLAAQIAAKLTAGGIRIPVLFLIAGEKDALVEPDAARAMFRKLEVPDKTIIEYPDMLHALSIDLGREKVFEDMLKWLEKRV